MSANHNHDFAKAKRMVRIAKECGADAIKLQTYTADTMTIDCDNRYFRINKGLWKGETLYSLYKKAAMPWEWQPKLKAYADKIGITLFSTAFDKTSVDFLEKMKVPVHKIASFELVDIPLIRYMASKKKPIIMSTGMASLDEIRLAVSTARKAGCKQLALLKCTSAYPAPLDEINLAAMQTLANEFKVPVGLSDHSMEPLVPVTAVAMGACIIEKHFTESRKDGGPDAAFSLEPDELVLMVKSIRKLEKIKGLDTIKTGKHEAQNLNFRKSLFVTAEMKKGERFSHENVRSIRPGHGLLPRFMTDVIGKKASMNIPRGTPLLKGHMA